MEIIKEWLVLYGYRMIIAVIGLLAGLFIIRIVLKLLKRKLNKAGKLTTKTKYLISISSITLKVLLIFTIVKGVGIDTTSFIALLASAGLAIGLALQGSLSNISGGFILIITKPFEEGDYINIDGNAGVVMDVGIYYTKIRTLDNRVIYLPNRITSSESVINYTKMKSRRLDIIVGVSYDADLKIAQRVLKDVAMDNSSVLKEPAIFIGISELGDSSVNILLRVWCEGKDYVSLPFALKEEIKLQLDIAGISIPYPQVDVHLDK